MCVRTYIYTHTHLDLVIGGRDAVDDDSGGFAGAVELGQEAGAPHGEVLGVRGVDVHLASLHDGVLQYGRHLHAFAAREFNLAGVFFFVTATWRKKENRRNRERYSER